MIKITNEPNIEELIRLNRLVHHLHLQSYPEFFRSENVDEAFRDYFRKSIEKPSFHHLIAWDGDTAVGFVQAEIVDKAESAFRKADRFIHLHIISVHPDFRGRGIGTQLINRVQELAAREKIKRIELSYWDKNIEAAEFYRKLGFMPMRHFIQIEVV